MLQRKPTRTRAPPKKVGGGGGTMRPAKYMTPSERGEGSPGLRSRRLKHYVGNVCMLHIRLKHTSAPVQRAIRGAVATSHHYPCCQNLVPLVNAFVAGHARFIVRSNFNHRHDVSLIKGGGEMPQKLVSPFREVLIHGHGPLEDVQVLRHLLDEPRPLDLHRDRATAVAQNASVNLCKEGETTEEKTERRDPLHQPHRSRHRSDQCKHVFDENKREALRA